MSNSDELYKWINERYEACIKGDISEDQYLKDLDEYKLKISQEEKKVTENSGKSKTKKVKSTSIAGLRSKLLEELKKD
jgi:hypothetical protein